ncbi:metallophosphoesterase [Aerococcaceae bacterium INB8]|uniref:Metallophosphoesterase n=1 Tax=Ruoffia halotolerans TaxID=2748684 RepID=A0A839A2V5_9LACT|nr:metallophosphoesterase [Ruoffia halotolerans]MBA5728241.1 metallophosphoesterase [Ruoffia halotolerans]
MNMRIGFISDLHVDNFTYEVQDYVDVLTEEIKKNELEMFVIGGDIANSYKATTHFVEALQEQANTLVYFIPGNHDLWDRETDRANINTMAIYQRYKEHPQCLIESPIMLTKRVGLVGHTAWYNYVKYNKEKFSLDKIKKGRYKGVTWQDKKYIQWPKEDPEMSKYFAEVIEKDIQKLHAESYILVTHMITIPKFTMPLPHRVFDFFNAYIATDDINLIYEKYPIEKSIMGHVHFRGEVERKGTLYITNSLGYVKEWRSKDMRKEIQNSLYIYDVK